MSSDLRKWAGLARSLAIYRARPWNQARLIEFYRGVVAPGDLVFDVGAHVGNRTLALVACGTRVVALEPQQPFYNFLRRTLPDGVTLLPYAAGANPGRARMAVSSLHPTMSSLKPGLDEQLASAPGFEKVSWDSEQLVAVTTLDIVIRDYGLPTFIKIDVEGFEAEVLEGLSLPVACIAFEYLNANLDVTRSCLTRLDALGPYAYNLTCGENYSFYLSEWSPSSEIISVLEKSTDRSTWGDIYAKK
jgi:FkbM family methyltransferase